MKIFFTIFILMIIIFAVAGIWYIGNKENKGTSFLPSQSLITKVTYICKGGKTIDAAFYSGKPGSVRPGELPMPSGSVKIFLSDGRSFALAQTISADGGRYANSDESFVFWSKGDGALILENNVEKNYTGCVVQTQNYGPKV